MVHGPPKKRAGMDGMSCHKTPDSRFPSVLVFSSSGQSLSYHVGALLFMEQKTSILPHVHTFAGCSGGGIIATLLAVGFSGVEVSELILQIDAIQCMSLSINALFQKGGLNPFQDIVHLFERLFTLKMSSEEAKKITLGDLKKKGVTLLLSVMRFPSRHSSRLNTDSICYLSPETFPDMPVCVAVTATLAMPGIVEPVLWEGRLFADGATVDSFPIRVFPPEETFGVQLVQPNVFVETGANAHSSETTSSGESSSTDSHDHGVLRPWSLLNLYYATLSSVCNNLLNELFDVENTFGGRYCKIDCSEYPAAQLHVNEADKRAMFRSGFCEVGNFVIKNFPCWCEMQESDDLWLATLPEASEHFKLMTHCILSGKTKEEILRLGGISSKIHNVKSKKNTGSHRSLRKKQLKLQRVLLPEKESDKTAGEQTVLKETDVETVALWMDVNET